MKKGLITDNVINTGRLSSIYRGVCEDNKDPKKAGRCRIRIFGIHSDSKIPEGQAGIRTEHLPWAEPAGPIFGGSSGVGIYGVPVQGAHVFVFFEAGDILQPRYFATALGIQAGGQKVSDTVGFSDPDGVYPKGEKVFDPDHNVGNKASDYTETYAIVGHCGHKIILDSTPLNETISIIHGVNGASINIDIDGNINICCSPSSTSYDAAGDRFITTTGHHTLSVSKDLLVSSKSSREMVGGTKQVEVTGSLGESVEKNWDMKAEGIALHSSDNFEIDAANEASIVASNDAAIASAEKNVKLTAAMKDIVMKAVLGTVKSNSLKIDMEASLSAKFTGMMTNIGETSMVTEIKGQVVMIG